MRVKMSKQPPPAPTASAVGPCPTVIQIVGRPGTGRLPSTIAPPDRPILAEEEQELEALVESLDKTCTRYKMEISAEKTKLMTNSANGIQREIKVKDRRWAL